MKIKVLHVRVGEAPEVKEVEHTLEALQDLVGGLLDVVALPDGVDLWCNDEALLVESPRLNRVLWRVNLFGGGSTPVFGDFFLARHDDEGNTVSLLPKDVKRYSQLFKL